MIRARAEKIEDAEEGVKCVGQAEVQIGNVLSSVAIADDQFLNASPPFHCRKNKDIDRETSSELDGRARTLCEPSPCTGQTRRTDVPLCCQKAESVPRVNVLKVGEVQSQLGQHCCDVGSFEDGDGSSVPTRVVGQELNQDDLAQGLIRKIVMAV